jgi:formyl-CoA transferase
LQQGALNDILIIDLSRILAGPYCTMLLGDMGAKVIKIEQPDAGDGSRQWGPPWVGSESAYFLSVNRNKRSVTVNLKHPAGQDLIQRLVSKADIFVENFLPGSVERFGLDYETLSSINPALVYCSITGYGQNGPYQDLPGFDFMIQAQGGIMSVTGPESGPPFKVGVAIVDITAGLFACSAILAALHHRDKTGSGQHIDIALLDSQIGWLVNLAHNYFATGETPGRYGNAHPNIVPYEVFRASDGYLALAIGTDNQYRRFCNLVSSPELWEDERFQTNAERVKHRSELIPLLQSLIEQRSVDDWLSLFAKNRIPAGAINDIETILQDQQVLARQMVQEVEHSKLGKIKQLGPVAKMSQTPLRISMAPPLLGEHTDIVLKERLGLDDAGIASLRKQGAI